MRVLLSIVSCVAVSTSAFANDEALRKQEALEASCNSKTILEALECLHSSLSKEDHDKVVNGSYDDLAMYHFGWGMGIRNSWDLWSGSTPIAQHFNEIGIFHPDDMSGIIIDSYWLHYNDCDLQLDEQVAYYRNYWDWAEKSEEADEPDDSFDIDKDFIECEV